jgi:hypothetical protein
LLAHEVVDVLILQVAWLFALVVDALATKKQVEGGLVNKSSILLD